ncbi:transcriptional adapter 2-beta [Clonorchis sinensis]|uniref:Transcriptional adapter 2-beta n=1 Tax=Clonorchis sinensis TaxID=79923 RepID=G7Y4I6_CLOSI|nr:transcriptional adapter 2-beta [Clonorchis sinensis]
MSDPVYVAFVYSALSHDKKRNPFGTQLRVCHETNMVAYSGCTEGINLIEPAERPSAGVKSLGSKTHMKVLDLLLDDCHRLQGNLVYYYVLLEQVVRTKSRMHTPLRFVSSLSPEDFQLFQSVPSDCLFSSHCDWSSKEEQRLLDAVETYGYGNWHEVSTQLPSRTAADCQHHFDQFYVFGAIGRHTIGKDNERSGVTLDHTVDDIGERCVTSLDLRPDEQKIIGYMPCRDEFEYSPISGPWFKLLTNFANFLVIIIVIKDGSISVDTDASLPYNHKPLLLGTFTGLFFELRRIPLQILLCFRLSTPGLFKTNRPEGVRSGLLASLILRRLTAARIRSLYPHTSGRVSVYGELCKALQKAVSGGRPFWFISVVDEITRRTLEGFQNCGIQIVADENLINLDYADDVLIFEVEGKHSYHANRRKHEGWDTARSPKPKQEKSRGGGRVRTTDFPISPSKIIRSSKNDGERWWTEKDLAAGNSRTLFQLIRPTDQYAKKVERQFIHKMRSAVDLPQHRTFRDAKPTTFLEVTFFGHHCTDQTDYSQIRMDDFVHAKEKDSLLPLSNAKDSFKPEPSFAPLNLGCGDECNSLNTCFVAIYTFTLHLLFFMDNLLVQYLMSDLRGWLAQRLETPTLLVVSLYFEIIFIRIDVCSGLKLDGQESCVFLDLNWPIGSLGPFGVIRELDIFYHWPYQRYSLHDLRLALVAIYNKHLADRHWRHQIAREHGLIPLLVRRLVEPHRRMNHFCYRPTGRFRVYGGPVQRKRRAGVSFTSRCRRKGSGRLVSGASSHFHRQSKFLTQLPELSEHSFVDYSGPHRLLTCDHVQSNRSLINTSLCTSCSDSGVLHVPFTCSTNEPCTAAQQSTTALQNSLPESDKLQPGVFTSSKSMGASLGSYNRFKKTSPTMSGKSSADALCFSSFSRCLGISSHTTSDSGIGSCDSCAQSTISTGSMNGDPFTYACSSGTPTTRLPLGRRPRSNSDSIYVSGSLFPGRKRSSELLANLQELRHQSESTPSLVHAVEPPAWVTDDKPSGSLNAVAQAALPSSQIASKATVKRRGRPLRRQSKRPCRPSSVSKLGNTTSDEYPTWMKPFLRFMTQQEARRFVVNLERESTLRSELAQLRDHHRKGVRSMTMVIQYYITELNLDTRNALNFLIKTYCSRNGQHRGKTEFHNVERIVSHIGDVDPNSTSEQLLTVESAIINLDCRSRIHIIITAVHKSFSDVPDSDVNIVFGWAAGTDTAAQVDEFVYCFSRLIRKHEAPALPPSFAAALYTLRTLNHVGVRFKKSANGMIKVYTGMPEAAVDSGWFPPFWKLVLRTNSLRSGKSSNGYPCIPSTMQGDYAVEFQQR